MAKVLTYFLFVLFIMKGAISFAQEEVLDSLAAKKNIEELQKEQKELNFQKFFFDALQQKAIGNYDKAIEALENCQNIRKGDVAVIFEFSKNYFEQEKFFEAITYSNQALEKLPDDIFILQHLKKIYVKQKNYKDALDIQLKIVSQKPQDQADLIILYIRNNRIEDARQLLIDLEEQGLLSESLAPFKQSLFPKGNLANQEPKQLSKQSLTELKASYANKKTFPVLKEILTEELGTSQFIDLEKDSKEGLGLFPAQPFVYLMHAKALNKLKKYDQAIPFLKNGLDYVIDDTNVEADFYEELSLSYKGLHKNVDASKYYNLALEKRQKKS